MSTQPLLVGDCGVLILAAVPPNPPTPTCGLNAGVESAVHQLDRGPWGQESLRDRSLLHLLPPGPPEAGLVAPGTPRCLAPLSHGSPSVVQDGAQASNPIQPDGG